MFNFMKWRWLYLGISSVIIIPGLISLVLFGLKLSQDFTGGSTWQIRSSTMNLEPRQIQDVIAPFMPDATVTTLSSTDFEIKGPEIANLTKNQALDEINRSLGETTQLSFETIGPAIGQELLLKTAVAVGLSFLLILLYLARQFSQLKYGVFAVVAMLHDCLVLLGSFSLLGQFVGVEVDILFVTALLTALSFSVHDTIVVYDRIRELLKLHRQADRGTVVNVAIWQTLSRSLNNSITVIVMLLALVLLGGETIRWFAVALLIGAITGTYSSTFVAVPLLYTWDNWSPKIQKILSKIPVPHQKSTR